jgi:hypothetical protein
MGEAQVHEFMSSSAMQNLCLVKMKTFNDGVHFSSPQGRTPRWGDEFDVSTGQALDKSHPWGVERKDEGVKRWVLDSVWAAGAHLMGRVTYEEMAAVWPTSTSEYARPMNEIPKVVFSKTLQYADWPETRASPAARSPKRSGVSSANRGTT